MAVCPYVDRQCTSECMAYRHDIDIKCMILHRADRATMLLNFIEKKIDRLLEINTR